MATSKITLGAGCFWCVETSFRRLKGVISAISGYSGGHKVNPTYKEVSFSNLIQQKDLKNYFFYSNKVCSENTGHAEVVQVEYNPNLIGTDKILEVFFFVHDPTQLNRQGNDIGTQYRSAVFYHNDEQKTLAEKMIAELNASGKFSSKLVTEVTKFEKFYPAEDYHQNYFNENGTEPYCQIVIKPKMDKFLKAFKAKLN
jgi:peptide-methionine (S)-S-oxide reductase